MSHLEENQDKIQKICSLLEKETLDPAKQEAKAIIDNAYKQAEDIVQKSHQKAQSIIEAAEKRIAKSEKASLSNVKQSSEQVIASLKQEIQQNLFNPEIKQWIETHLGNDDFSASVGKQLLSFIEKEGADADLTLIIGSQADQQKMIAAIGQDLLNRLKKSSVEVGDFKGGVQIRLNETNLVVDLSDEALFELLERFLRKEVRDVLFTS